MFRASLVRGVRLHRDLGLQLGSARRGAEAQPVALVGRDGLRKHLFFMCLCQNKKYETCVVCVDYAVLLLAYWYVVAMCCCCPLFLLLFGWSPGAPRWRWGSWRRSRPRPCRRWPCFMCAYVVVLCFIGFFMCWLLIVYCLFDLVVGDLGHHGRHREAQLLLPVEDLGWQYLSSTTCLIQPRLLSTAQLV